MKKYSVQPGDTLFNIAQREYGDGALYTVIAEQNHLADPDLITVGQELLVPYVTMRHRAEADEVSTQQRAQITQKYYGTTDPHISEIWEQASGVLQLPFFEGAWLLIPDLADAGHHTVVDGETFFILADRWYGDGALGHMIKRANHLDPSSEATPGQLLLRPLLNPRRQVFGTTLEVLCRDVYGDHDLATRVAVVAAANFITDPSKVFANQVVFFPDR